MTETSTTPTPTGDLGRLLTWWQDHGPRAERSIAWVVDPADPDDARNLVDRAIDSGASLIALLGRGHDRAARATIARLAKVTPVEVRDQRSDMTDIEWMQEVAAIRDLRANHDSPSDEAAIGATAAALTTAMNRKTPVIFDGLVAHAGAMTCGAFDTSWLPASSSTDPAIQVAQQHWRVQPGANLQLHGDDDSGIRAVLALLDVVDTH